MLLAACGSSAYVHPTKPADAYLADWSKCGIDISRDPKLQQGNALLVTLATERCMKKIGWRLVEDAS